MKYQLCVSTVHCIGRLNHVVGVVDKQAEAKAWVNGLADGGFKPALIPEDDPMAWCPVKHCHMKRQKPARSYHEKAVDD